MKKDLLSSKQGKKSNFFGLFANFIPPKFYIIPALILSMIFSQSQEIHKALSFQELFFFNVFFLYLWWHDFRAGTWSEIIWCVYYIAGTWSKRGQISMTSYIVSPLAPGSGDSDNHRVRAWKSLREPETEPEREPEHEPEPEPAQEPVEEPEEEPEQ